MIETPRLRLRRFRPADAAPCAAIRAKPAVMRFMPGGETRCAAAPPSAVPLEGEFRIAALAGGAPPEGRLPATVTLLPGRYAATAGCNRVSGAWEGTAEALRFRPGAMTRMACPPPLDAADAALVDALSDAARAERDGAGWRVLAADGREVMRLRPASRRG